jgi:hypothetical protein
MGQSIQHYCWLLCVVGVIAGCSASEEAFVEEVPVDAPVVADAAPMEQPAASTSTTPDTAKPEAAAVAVAEFVAPFPERQDLFEAPKRDKSSVRQEDEQGTTVELKGFINVDEPKVVLSIDGVISPIPEGGEKYGVQVLDIEPPSVVLQRGRSRWTATLE